MTVQIKESPTVAQQGESDAYRVSLMAVAKADADVEVRFVYQPMVSSTATDLLVPCCNSGSTCGGH